MRLSHHEKQTILNAVKTFDPEARVYLFGSRVDDAARGGDIDLLIFSQRITFEDKLRIKAMIFQVMEEQKIDMIIAQDASEPFVNMALKDSVELE